MNYIAKAVPAEGDVYQQMNTDWDTIGYVISSKYRIKVVRELAEGSATPKSLSEEINCSISHVSRALRGLRERSLIQLTVPEQQQKNRLYKLTDDGEQLWETIQANDLTA